ncbi:MAG: sigma-70 family RNA polymerase sigma factor [Leptospirales bacterium]|nr:sigma-70 family RNA polymerase sigma factor [Leptospirales bacterium]
MDISRLTSHPMEKKQLTDPLKHLPRAYYESEDMAAFMNGCAPWILRYVQVRLTRDPDLAGDFYLHFYEKKGQACLKAYSTRQDIPFTGFLAVYLRNEFSNFLRTRKRKTIEAFPTEDLSRLPNVESVPDSRGDRLLDRLTDLPLELRLPLKLHYGMDLTAPELRALAISRGPEDASRMLCEMASRRKAHLTRSEQRIDRAGRLNHLIHARPSGRLHRWKDRIVQALEKPTPIFSYAEIGKFLGTSKTTIARRIDMARAHLRRAIELEGAIQ